MPDEQGNLLPGDEGFVAPETPAESPSETAQTEEQAPEQGSTDEAETVEEAPSTPRVETRNYDKLLAAYKKLKLRSMLDITYESQLDKEAGL